jgi:hypothetical protein
LAFALVKLLSESKQKLRTKEMLPEASLIKSLPLLTKCAALWIKPK